MVTERFESVQILGKMVQNGRYKIIAEWLLIVHFLSGGVDVLVHVVVDPGDLVSHGSLNGRVSVSHGVSLNSRVGVSNRLLDLVFDGLDLLDLDLGLSVDNRGNLVGVGSVASVPRWVVSVSLVENVGISFSLSLGVPLGKVMVSTVDSGVLVDHGLVVGSVSHGVGISDRGSSDGLSVGDNGGLDLLNNGLSLDIDLLDSSGLGLMMGMRASMMVDHGLVSIVEVRHLSLVHLGIGLSVEMQGLEGLDRGGLLGGHDSITIVFHMVIGLSHGKSQKRGQNLSKPIFFLNPNFYFPNFFTYEEFHGDTNTGDAASTTAMEKRGMTRLLYRLESPGVGTS